MGPQRMFGMTPWVRRLFVATLLVYVLQETVLGRGALAAFGFDPLSAFARPWTFLTYVFIHGSLFHLAFNLLALFVFGSRVEERLGGRTFLWYYAACGVGGAVLSLALTQLYPVGIVVGASGAVLGVALAFAWFYPDALIFVFPLPAPIPARWLVTFAVAIDLALALFRNADGVAHLAHLGGIGTGFLWLKLRDRREARAVVPPAAAPGGGVLVQRPARSARAGEAQGRPRRSSRGDRVQAEMDRLLDKISAQGLDSLTPAERKFLAETSRKLRDRN
jgi:rhomboid family protein